MIRPLIRGEGYRLISFGLRYPDPEDLRAGFSEAEGTPLDSFAELGHLVDDTMAGEYNRLFATGVAVPPYESSYGRIDKGVSIGQVATLYAQFGVKVGAGEQELPDHAGTEAEFMALLCVLEEKARREGSVEEVASVGRARRIFAEEHLARWLPTFAERLGEATVHPFYRKLAELMSAWVATDMEEHEWQAEVAHGPADDKEPDCVACPMARGEGEDVA
jgi:TorA maturation chaperone TorD